MKTKTNTYITIAVAILIAAVFVLRGKPTDHPKTLATESVPPGEAEEILKAVALIKQQILDRDGTGMKRRGAHPKHHGCVLAEFQVVSNLHESLVTNLFLPGAKYAAWIRFSNNADPASDSKPDARGMAIKLLDVPGEKLTGHQSAQDILLISHPVFLFADVETYVDGFDALKNDRPLRFFFNPFGPQIDSFRISRQMMVEHKDLLAIRWWSAVPYQYGAGRAVKYSARPCSYQSRYGPEGDGNFLLERLSESLSHNAACFEFMVQFQSDPASMPIENATVEWDETLAPFQPIAVITIPPQNFNNAERIRFCENASFNPWRALPAHRPLGGINRARRAIYQELSRFRHEQNGISQSGS